MLPRLDKVGVVGPVGGRCPWHKAVEFVTDAKLGSLEAGGRPAIDDRRIVRVKRPRNDLLVKAVGILSGGPECRSRHRYSAHRNCSRSRGNETVAALVEGRCAEGRTAAR